MTTKFLQALAKLKPSSSSQVRDERSKSETIPRGAVAFQSDVYRRKRVVTVANAPRTRVAEH